MNRKGNTIIYVGGGRIPSLWLFLCLSLGVMHTCRAESVTTKPLGENALPQTFDVHPKPLDLAPQTLPGIKKLPSGVTRPLYGALSFGPKEKPATIAVVMDGAATGEPHIWIDANANGDLTDDAVLSWTKSGYQAFDGRQLWRYQSHASVQVRYDTQIVPLHLNLVRFDPTDPNREQYKNTLLYSADYGRELELPLGNTKYHALLYDVDAVGDYRGKTGPMGTGIFLFIDVNGNGQFDRRGEMYEISQPFTIKGVTYEIANISASGDRMEIVKSKKSVPEILPPPDLRVGKPVLPFTRKTLDGKTVHFPTDYKGKLVLLYFWASYCPDCQAEIPNVRQAYKQFHERGLDILGVSVDPDNLPIPLKSYTEQSNMRWPQIYEAKFWQGELVQEYFINTIPTGFLVDGTTGLILASGQDLHGPKLAQTLQKFIEGAPH